MSTNHTLTEMEIARRLEEANRQRVDTRPDGDPPNPLEFFKSPPRPAAVLIPLLRSGKAWHLLFTRRNDSLAEHSGQVAFPGGRADPDDRTPEATALREAREEIGIEPADVQLLGRLRDFITITNYRVTPVVGVIPWPYPLRPAQVEVSRVFTIPLDWLANAQNYEEQERPLPHPHGSASVLYYHPYQGETLWGASARFTHMLLQDLNLLQ